MPVRASAPGSSGAAPHIRTYTLADRALAPDFSIHDESHSTRIEQAHRHAYFQIQLNLSGQATQHIGATVRPLPPGGLSFVLPYRVHRVLHPPGSRFFVISFDQRFLRPELDVDALDLQDTALDRAPELAPFVYQEFMDFRLTRSTLGAAHEACARMLTESTRRETYSTEVTRAHLLMLLCMICRAHHGVLARIAAGAPRQPNRRDALVRVMRHCRSHLHQRITLADAAAAAGLSPNYLARLLKKETGKSFVDLLTERRMERAKELLTHTDTRIGRIASAVGFDDEAYFARRFRQFTGHSPRAYRNATALAHPRQESPTKAPFSP